MQTMAEVSVRLPYKIIANFGETKQQEALIDYFGSSKQLLLALKNFGVSSVEVTDIYCNDNIRLIERVSRTIKNAGLKANFHLYQIYSTPYTDFFEFYSQFTQSTSFIMHGINENKLMSQNRGQTAKFLRQFSDYSARKKCDHRFYLSNGKYMANGHLIEECEEIEKILLIVSRKNVGACFDFVSRIVSTKYADKTRSLIPDERFYKFIKYVNVGNFLPGDYENAPLYDLCDESRTLLEYFSDRNFDGTYNLKIDFERYYTTKNPGKALCDSLIKLNEFIGR